MKFENLPIEFAPITKQYKKVREKESDKYMYMRYVKMPLNEI